jgi:hypothetical protein
MNIGQHMSIPTEYSNKSTSFTCESSYRHAHNNNSLVAISKEYGGVFEWPGGWSSVRFRREL